MNPNILILEDDKNLGFLLQQYLNGAGYHSTWVQSGGEALEKCKKKQYQLAILDIMLPGLSGYDVAEKLKSIQAQLPFIFLTAKLMREDRIRGLTAGADDYITKPFDEVELLLRIQNILRRNSNEKVSLSKDRYQIGQFSFVHSQLELQLGTRIEKLTEKEADVLQLLCQHENQVLRRNKALQLLYGEADYFLGRSFDVFICKLRKKLSEDPSVKIENIFKVGFMLKTKGGASEINHFSNDSNPSSSSK